MKASELMIGDWVRVKPHKGYYEGITQVLGIPDRSTLKHNGHVDVELHYFDEIENCDSYEVEDCEDRRIEPISLTEEILKANGWSYDDINCEWFHDKCPLILFSPWNERGGYVLSCYNSIEFKSVHELQHALRLCGLNDLADNFKIQED